MQAHSQAACGSSVVDEATAITLLAALDRCRRSGLNDTTGLEAWTPLSKTASQNQSKRSHRNIAGDASDGAALIVAIGELSAALAAAPTAASARAIASALAHTTMRGELSRALEAARAKGRRKQERLRDDLARANCLHLRRYVSFGVAARRLSGAMPGYAPYAMPFDVAVTAAHLSAAVSACVLPASGDPTEAELSCARIVGELAQGPIMKLQDASFTFLDAAIRRRSAEACVAFLAAFPNNPVITELRGVSADFVSTFCQQEANDCRETGLLFGSNAVFCKSGTADQVNVRIVLFERGQALVQNGSGDYAVVATGSLYEPDALLEHLVVLGLRPGATQEEISCAFRRLAKTHHPDKGGNGATFQNIRAAFEALCAVDSQDLKGDEAAADPTHEVPADSVTPETANVDAGTNNYQSDESAKSDVGTAEITQKTPEDEARESPEREAVVSANAPESPTTQVQNDDMRLCTPPRHSRRRLRCKTAVAGSPETPVDFRQKASKRRQRSSGSSGPTLKRGSSRRDGKKHATTAPLTTDVSPLHELNVNGLMQHIWSFVF